MTSDTYIRTSKTMMEVLSIPKTDKMNIIAIIVALSLAGTSAYPADNRVVNGTDARPGEIPYIVVLQYYGSITCGGSILDEYHVLSAAHCVQGGESNPGIYSIVYGTIYQKDNKNAIPVSKITYHEDYTPGNGYRNDVSVLRLRDPIPFSEYAQPTVLPPKNQPTPGGSDALLAGWGRPSDYEPPMDVLQKAHLGVYTDEECTRIHGVTDGDHHICAGIPEGGRGQCSGDSGGPLYANGVQIGLVSWSVKPCARKGYPGVYTKVSVHVDWIRKQMQD